MIGYACTQYNDKRFIARNLCRIKISRQAESWEAIYLSIFGFLLGHFIFLVHSNTTSTDLSLGQDYDNVYDLINHANFFSEPKKGDLIKFNQITFSAQATPYIIFWILFIWWNNLSWSKSIIRMENLIE